MLSKDKVRAIRSQLEPFLDVIGEELNLKLTLCSCTYREVIMFKLEVAPIDAEGKSRSKMADDFEIHARGYGLKAEDLGRTFTFSGSLHTIEGAKPRSKRYPILCRRKDDGKLYKFPADAIRRWLRDEKDA